MVVTRKVRVVPGKKDDGDEAGTSNAAEENVEKVLPDASESEIEKDEEDLQDSEQEPKKDFPSLKKRISQGHQTEQNKADQFFDVCNEKINTLAINDVPKAKKPKKKKTLTSEEKSSKKAAGGSKKRPSKKSKKKQANIEVVTTKD